MSKLYYITYRKKANDPWTASQVLAGLTKEAAGQSAQSLKANGFQVKVTDEVGKEITLEAGLPGGKRLDFGDVIGIDRGDLGIDFFFTDDLKKLMFLNAASERALLAHLKEKYPGG